jgi:hypothetical protein
MTTTLLTARFSRDSEPFGQYDSQVIYFPLVYDNPEYGDYGPSGYFGYYGSGLLTYSSAVSLTASIRVTPEIPFPVTITFELMRKKDAAPNNESLGRREITIPFYRRSETIFDVDITDTSGIIFPGSGDRSGGLLGKFNCSGR